MRSSVRSAMGERGASAIEFALLFPLFVVLVIGALEMGARYMAQAGLANGVNGAARLATIYPTPNDEAIRAEILSNSFGIQPNRLTSQLQRGTDPQLGDYIVLDATYRYTSLTSMFITVNGTLTERRKVWVSS